MLILLAAGCGKSYQKSDNFCPSPIVPNEHVAEIIDIVSEAEPDFKDWANEQRRQELKLKVLYDDRK